MRKYYVVYYKNESGFGMQWETPGDYNASRFKTEKQARECIRHLVSFDPQTWEETEFKIEHE